MAANRYLKPGLVVALIASLLLAGVAFATPLLQRSQVAVACVNTGLAQSAQSHRFAGPSKHRPCSGPRHKRALAGRVAVTRAPEVSIPVPPVTRGRPGVVAPVAIEDGSPVAQPPRDTTPPETSISAGPA